MSFTTDDCINTCLLRPKKKSFFYDNISDTCSNSCASQSTSFTDLEDTRHQSTESLRSSNLTEDLEAEKFWVELYERAEAFLDSEQLTIVNPSEESQIEAPEVVLCGSKKFSFESDIEDSSLQAPAFFMRRISKKHSSLRPVVSKLENEVNEDVL